MIKRAKIAQTYLNWRLFNFLNLKGINNPDGEITNKKERHDLSSGFRAILKVRIKVLFSEKRISE